MKAFETLESEILECWPSKRLNFGRKRIYFLFPSSMKTKSGKPDILILADHKPARALMPVMTINLNPFSLDYIPLPVACF